MEKIKKNLHYMEGTFQANTMIKNIDKTTYGTIDGAINVKEAVIERFEKDLHCSREDEEPMSDYAFNLGILDRLKQHRNEANKE